MIKIKYNKTRETKGITYYLELKHIINIRNKYNIIIDRTTINDKYNIKQYNKS